MRIGLNLLYLLPGVVGGSQTYAVSLIRALASLDTRNEYILYLNRESADLEITDAPHVRRVICPIRAVRRPARYAYEQLALPAALRRDRIDLLHSLGYVGPLFPPCRHVVSILDLIYRGHQVMMTGSKQKALEFFVKQVARRSDRIITISENSKREIAEDIEINPQKIAVTYLAGRPAAALLSPAERAPILSRYGITAPYLIVFSSPNPIKNVVRLMEAFALVCAGLPHQLVVVGHLPDGMSIPSEAARHGVSDRVIGTGYVPDADIAPLLQGADLFAFPSLYEGFGLPLLDAQQAGVPVISSNAASLPEVAGDGAVLFDPVSVPEMAAAMRSCLQDQELRERLIEQGFTNARRFSWEATARQTLAVYQQIERREKSV